MRKTILLLLLAFATTVHQSCILDKCRYQVDDWRELAAGDNAEMRGLLKELAAYGYEPTDDQVFIRSWDQSMFGIDSSTSLHDMPKVKQWMRNHPEGFISFRNGEIQVQLYRCQFYSEYNASLYNYRPETHQFKLGVELVDSLSIGNGWYYWVTKCSGCDD